MKKGTLLTKNHVPGLSYYQNKGVFYFSGAVEAEMKNLLYAIKLILSKEGDITSSGCECPAGAGPHSTCKHVVAGEKTYFFNSKAHIISAPARPYVEYCTMRILSTFHLLVVKD